MKRIFLLIAALSLGLSTRASAWTGGPFDNGDYSILIERGGVYQATFSFRNGSGMALFNENNSFEPATATTVTGMFSINNRSVFYYKGVTYFGTATGIVDVDARRVTGFTNGSSDYYATTAANVGPASQSQAGAARPSNIGFNGNIGYVANSTFKAKITSTRPIMRFRGSGTVTFMGFPDLAEIHTALTSATTEILTNLTAGTTMTAAQASAAINQIISLAGDISNPSVPQTFQESQSMRVYGSRRFF